MTAQGTRLSIQGNVIILHILAWQGPALPTRPKAVLDQESAGTPSPRAKSCERPLHVGHDFPRGVLAP